MKATKIAMAALPLAGTVVAGLIVTSAAQAVPSGKQAGADLTSVLVTAGGARLSSGGDEGGIAGVSLSENFESGFVAGAGCNQNGWLGFCGAGVGFLIVENIPADPVFGSFSALHQSDGSAIAGVEIRSPELAAPETGRLEADIQISDTASAYLFQTSPCTVTGCLINTRINFNTNGNIEVLQLQPGNCTTGVFTDSGADWVAGTTFRIGIEVDGAGVLTVYKDGTSIFTGTDISVACAPAGPQGISNMGIFAVNAAAATTTLRLDNISSGGGASCAQDVSGGDGVVDINDLLSVVGVWGQSGAPGFIPQDITGPSAAPDGVIDINDLLAVVGAWGPCP